MVPNRANDPARKISIENKAYIEGMREIRRSNKAGTHLDKRTRRARTRLDSRTKAIQESQNDG